MEAGPTIRITQVGAYVFTVDFGAALPDLLTDQALPVGAPALSRSRC